jgi:hypothetical protein
VLAQVLADVLDQVLAGVVFGTASSYTHHLFNKIP